MNRWWLPCCAALSIKGVACGGTPLPLVVRTNPAPPVLHAFADAGIPTPDRRIMVLQAAANFLAGAPLRAKGMRFSADPVGFVRAAFWTVGIELFDPDVFTEGGEGGDGADMLYRSVGERRQVHHQTPDPGDLIFFSPDGNGQPSRTPHPTQVGIVERIAADGTLRVIGRFAHGPARISINLRAPSSQRDGSGKQINSTLSSGSTAAKLFVAFADPFG